MHIDLLIITYVEQYFNRGYIYTHSTCIGRNTWRPLLLKKYFRVSPQLVYLSQIHEHQHKMYFYSNDCNSLFATPQ